jgi:hypothetical protein
MDYQINDKVELCMRLTDMYVESIIELLDSAYNLWILPYTMIFMLGTIKDQIRTNRFEMVRYGTECLLDKETKKTIINFDTSKLENLDSDFDDNITVKTCINNFSNYNNNSENYEPNLILELIIEIKNNAKKLQLKDRNKIKEHILILVDILENLEKIFK